MLDVLGKSGDLFAVFHRCNFLNFVSLYQFSSINTSVTGGLEGKVLVEYMPLKSN